MLKLFLTVLLAVLAESSHEKMPLKLNGSSIMHYQPLKIHSVFLPKDRESKVQLKVVRTGTLATVPVLSQKGNVIPDNATSFGSTSVRSMNKGYGLDQKRYIRTSRRATSIPNELVKNSIPVRSQERYSLIDNVLGYLNLGVPPDDDLKIDPEFEHLPEVHNPKVDPEFEHLPITESSNFLEEYDFPTQKFAEIPAENSNDGKLQIPWMLNMVENSTDPTMTPDAEYYFDIYTDESESVGSIKINPNDTVKHSITGLETSLGTSQEQNGVGKIDFTSQFNDNVTEEANPEISNSTNEYIDEYDYYMGNDLIHHSLKNSFFDVIDDKFRSLVFNPVARPHEKFQECKTPRNENGHCRYVQHCFLPNIIASLGNFMRHVCIIQERFIGICCPEFPVHTLEVQWKLPTNELQIDTAVNITQPEGGCGISSKTRIVGGSKADPKEWPWMAALLSKTRGNFFCGGALINSKFVLTAAHCTFRVPQNQILVRLGEYDFSNSSDGPGEDFPVVEIRRHALFSRKTLSNDIALLKLGRLAKFSQFVSTICLPESNAGYIGQMATLAGWGNVKGGGPTSEVLLEASFPVWSNAECSDVQGIPIRKVFMCAGSRQQDKGACNGDSGGPLMLLDENTKLWKAIGIVSWGRRGCDTKYPTVFTRVSSYLRWIKVHSTD